MMAGSKMFFQTLVVSIIDVSKGFEYSGIQVIVSGVYIFTNVAIEMVSINVMHEVIFIIEMDSTELAVRM